MAKALSAHDEHASAETFQHLDSVTHHVAKDNLTKFFRRQGKHFKSGPAREALLMHFSHHESPQLADKEFARDFCALGLKVLDDSGLNHYESRGGIRAALECVQNQQSGHSEVQDAWVFLNGDYSFVSDVLFEYFSLVVYRTVLSHAAQEAHRKGAVGDPGGIADVLGKALCKGRGKTFRKFKKAWEEVLKTNNHKGDFQYTSNYYLSEASKFEDRMAKCDDNSKKELKKKKKKCIQAFTDYLYKCFGSSIPTFFSCKHGNEERSFVGNMNKILDVDLQSSRSINIAFSAMKDWLYLVATHQDMCLIRRVHRNQRALDALERLDYTRLPEIAISGVGYAYIVEIVATFCSHLAAAKHGKRETGIKRRFRVVFH